MASIVVTQKPAEYFTFTAQHSPIEEQTNDASSTYWNSSPFTDDFLSDDSILTSPTTPGSPPDFRSAFPALTSTHKRKQREIDEVEEPLDLGSFEDWLRWDDNEDPLTDMNNLCKQDPEDTVVFIEDPVSSSPLFQSRQINSSNLVGVQPRETLYSPPTPVWSFPAGRSPQQLQQQSQLPYFASSLSPQEEARLRDIAMPSSSSSKLPTPVSRTSSMGYPASPSPPAQQQTTNNSSTSPSRRPTLQTALNTRQRKRKSTSSSNNQQLDEDSDDFEDHTPTKSNASNNTGGGRGKKSSHNMIEKRYRNNLNDKIAELRDSVPSLRVMSKHEQMDDDDDMGGNEEDLQGLTPAHKLNKATILSKATEYIAHLEKRNTYLARENAGLKARVDAFEILVMARPQQQQQQAGGYQQQRQDYQQGYEAGQRAFRQQGGGGNVGQSPGWVA